ncbi:hypothetical protein [Robertkochia flava]|uniref:hypothetical protein n=1 Tax=Robertkochia flava TaxID=3447986 RepID=UPI001CCACF42|nr:hypothetical protein [Robertkochia marina]
MVTKNTKKESRKKVKDQNQSIQFWTKTEESEKPTRCRIIESKFIEFLSKSGFAKVMVNDSDYILVQEKNNVVIEIPIFIIAEYVEDYLKKLKEFEVLETFTKGSPSYLSKAKLQFLKRVEPVKDRDGRTSSYFFFQNQLCKVDKDEIKNIPYAKFKGKIWASRINEHEYTPPHHLSRGSMFEVFCANIANNNGKRLLALKTNLGYLMHRYHDPANPRAIILMDEVINFDGTANGGTGKSLLLKGVEKMREVVTMDGKNIKTKSWFKNQRITRTTDVVFYDDVTTEFNMESLYSMITTGIPIERKQKAEEFIKPEDAPKIAISSNYVVRGTGGNTDARRRCEFEVHNYYNLENTPESEFGCIFFTGWDKLEWNKFFHFMMTCVKEYLTHGLIIAEPINLTNNTIVNNTSPEFYSFMEVIEETDTWLDKRECQKLFHEEFPNMSDTSSHKFTKWLKAYATAKGYVYDDRSSGGKYSFILKTDKTRKEVNNAA